MSARFQINSLLVNCFLVNSKLNRMMAQLRSEQITWVNDILCLQTLSYVLMEVIVG